MGLAPPQALRFWSHMLEKEINKPQVLASPGRHISWQFLTCWDCWVLLTLGSSRPHGEALLFRDQLWDQTLIHSTNMYQRHVEGREGEAGENSLLPTQEHKPGTQVMGPISFLLLSASNWS